MNKLSTKKTNALIAILLAIMLSTVALSCASKSGGEDGRPEIKEENVTVGKGRDKAEVPEWYLNPPLADDKFYGTGTSKLAKLDAAKKAAIASAREDIAFQIQAQIEASLTEYFQESGEGDNTQAINFAEQVSRQVTNTTLSGTRNEKVSVGDDGQTIYALVSLPKENIREAAADSFARNEDAAFAEFKAQEALARLDAQLADNPTQAGQNR